MLVITEEWFDRLRRAEDYVSWRWTAIGITRLVMLFGVPLAVVVLKGGTDE